MKILYFDTKATTEKIGTYSYYNGTYSELCKIAEVTTVRHPISDIRQVWNDNYDGIIFGLGWFSNSNSEYFKKINGLDNIQTPVLCNLHKVANDTSLKIDFVKLNGIKTVMMSPGFINDFKKTYTDIHFHLFPFAAHADIFYPNRTKSIDLGFSGALHNVDNGKKIKNGYTAQKAILREKMTKIINTQMNDCNVFWNTATNNTLLPELEYAQVLRESKIWFATDSPAEEIVRDIMK